MTDQPEVNIDAFKEYIDKKFDVSLFDEVVCEMTLANVEELPKDNTVRETPPFRLRFVTEPSCDLKDGIYKVSNDDCGSHDLYLTVEGDNEVTKSYEALFR